MRDVSTITSERLHLVHLTPGFIEASLAGRRAEAETLIVSSLPADWPTDHARRVMQYRARQMAEDADVAPWLLRAMVRQSDRQVIGYINFHGPPNERGQAELGYTVFEEHQRLGYASEAATAMMAWARNEYSVRRFIVSISPTNSPSLAMAAKLGFRRIGEQIDDEDGEEYVFELVVP